VKDVQTTQVVVWRSGIALWFDQRSSPTSGPVSPGMDDRIRYGTLISVCNQPLRSTQLGHFFVGRRNDYQSEGGEALQLEEYKVRSLCGSQVWSPCYTWAMSDLYRCCPAWLPNNNNNVRLLQLQSERYNKTNICHAGQHWYNRTQSKYIQPNITQGLAWVS